MIVRPYRQDGGRRFCGRLTGAGIAFLVVVACLSPPVMAREGGGFPRGTIPDFLACHETVVRNLESGDMHSYQFVLEAGEVFTIDAVDISGTIELLRLRLISPEGTNLGSTCTGRLPMRAPEDGVYILQVSDCIGNDPGKYSLTMNVVSDTVHSCAEPIACGVDVEGQLEVGGQANTYAFYGARSEPVSLDFETTLEGGRGGLEVRVFDPDGVAVLHSCGSSFDFNLPNTGRFTVLVNACLGKNTGTYELAWRSRSCPTHVGAHSGGGGMGLRLSNDGTQVVQVAASSLSCAYNDSSGFVVDLNPPVNIVNGRFATSIRTQDAETPAIQIDGVFVDLEHTQILGGMSVLFGRANARCNFQWAATKDDDEDWDGWSDAVEISFSSRATSSRSTPEDHDLPSTALYGPGVCRDRLDNDGDDRIDAAEGACFGSQPSTRSIFTAYAGRHSGAGAFSVERSADGSRVARILVTSFGCGAIEPGAAAIDVDIPIIDNGFLARDIVFPDSSVLAGLEFSVDGFFFDTDGDNTRDQAVGGLILRFGTECRYKWWASAQVDSDGDGWGDVAERRYNSDARPIPSGLGMESIPEEAGLPLTVLNDTPTCNDGIDNDGNHFADSDDWKCPAPTPTATSTATNTMVPTVTPTRAPTRTATAVATFSAEPTEQATATPQATSTQTIAGTGTPFPTTPTIPPATSSPLPTQTPMPTIMPQACAGDCDENGSVSVNEVILQILIGLGGGDIETCPAGDGNGNGSITVDEVVAAVNKALNGCP